VGRARELAPQQAQPGLELFLRLPGAPAVAVALRRDLAGADEDVGGHGEAGFAEVQELLVHRERRILRRGGERRRPVARHQVLHDRDRLDHGDIAIGERRDEPARVDRHELRIVLDALQQVDRPQPVRKPHLLQQPDDPKPPAFTPDGDHVHVSFSLTERRYAVRAATAIAPTAPAMTKARAAWRGGASMAAALLTRSRMRPWPERGRSSGYIRSAPARATSERPQDAFDHLLGVAEQHHGVVAEEELVLDP